MDRGVLTFKTGFSDSDFKIEWIKVREIYTESIFLISLTDGTRLNGSLSSQPDGNLVITTLSGTEYEADLPEVVYLKAIDSGFWDQLYASISLGYNYTKANDLQQFSLRSSLGYLARRWAINSGYNSISSIQTDVDPNRRTDANVSFSYFLPKDWYLVPQINFLSNTEQKLDLRTSSKFGVGKYFIHTNRTYWGFIGGFSYNNEQFADTTQDRNSLEGYLGTELNLYDIGDLSLITNTYVYPGITEKGRWRVDFTLDAKYDLPLDFFIKLGFTLNYDNQPVEGASESDYIFQTTFGWEL